MTGVSEDGDITEEGGELTWTMGLEITVSVTMWWYPVQGGGGGGGLPKLNRISFEGVMGLKLCECRQLFPHFLKLATG